MTFRTVLSRNDCLTRLKLVFPRTVFDPVLANPLAAAAVTAMVYINAVVDDEGPIAPDATLARPTTCLWLCDDVLTRTADAERAQWRDAALASKRALVALLATWGIAHKPWYGDNSRETLRDETFPAWLDHGAMRVRPGIPTTSSKPRWALTASFADLFDPGLADDELDEVIEEWRDTHMSPGHRVRIRTARERDRRSSAVEVTLPSGEQRILEPGDASLVLKGVLEQWARARLIDPVVLTVSEPGDKIYIPDGARLAELGISVNASMLLPDVLVVDIGEQPPTFWVVEAVASDGPVTDDRRIAFLKWARHQRIPESSLRFLSAFISRNDPAARRRLKDLAAGTYAWYLDEPTRELAWYEIDDPDPA